MQNWNGKLSIRYCHERDVQKKRFIFLKFKARLLQIWKHMQLQGQTITLLKNIEKWIDDNMDTLVDEFVNDHGRARVAALSRFKSTKTPPGFGPP